MQVEKLYILLIGCGEKAKVDKEISNGGLALYNKYIKRGMPTTDVALITVTGTADNIQYACDKGSLPTKEPQKSLTVGVSKGVGVYVFAHGTNFHCGGLRPDALAKLLSVTIGLTSIRKLCLVSCSVGKRINPTEKGYLELLCEELHGQGLDPLIAGYDSFVTIAYENMDEHVPHKTKSAKHTVTSELAGKKILQGLKGESPSGHGARVGKPVFVRGEGISTPEQTENLLKAHKFVWQFVDGEAELNREGWSDKK